jgi:hypothetical protein
MKKDRPAVHTHPHRQVNRKQICALAIADLDQRENYRRGTEIRRGFEQNCVKKKSAGDIGP